MAVEMTEGMPSVPRRDVAAARRVLSRHGAFGLWALLVPAVLFPLCLVWVSEDRRFAWVYQPTAYPWELWVFAVCSVAATIAGVSDWRIHRSGTTVVGRREHQAHIAALVFGGGPLVLLMAMASVRTSPYSLLLPILVLLIVSIVIICYDEFMFHRRCDWIETLAHRVATFGYGFAFLAWSHWCFVRGGGYA